MAVLILTKKKKRKLTEMTFYDQHHFSSLQQNYHFGVFVFDERASFFFNQLCVIIHTFTSSPALLRVTPFQKIHFAKCCHTALFTWRREATATSEINPLWARMSLPHTCTQTHTVCSRLGCAAQSKWISSSLIWLVLVAIWDWDDKAMTSASLTAAKYEVAFT